MRAALYARVSTNEQDEGMQLREMREFAERRKWSAEIFADPGYSGAKVSRPELDRMLALCRHRKFDVVVVYRFDRFARSTKQLVDALEEFGRLGIEFVSLHEQVDTSTPNGKLLFHIFAAISEFERSLIRERVISGIANARAKGKRLGRPRRNPDVEQIRALRRYGFTWRHIAEQMGISVATAKRVVLVAQKPASEVPQ
jgi:putative DNA-invertase from lambdoid prophage Rac